MNAVPAECRHCAPSGFHLVSLNYNLDISFSITPNIIISVSITSHHLIFHFYHHHSLPAVPARSRLRWNVNWGDLKKRNYDKIAITTDRRSQKWVAWRCVLLFSRLRARIQEREKNIKLVIGIRFIFSFLNLYFLVPKKQHSVKAFWHLCNIVKKDEVTTSKLKSWETGEWQVFLSPGF